MEVVFLVSGVLRFYGDQVFLERHMNMKLLASVRRFAVTKLCLLAFIASILLGSLPAVALPERGTPAPPLQFTQLLQAPPGARADWPSLRGKVVVLEFWSTHCGPCIAEIPHLNKLVASLDPARFQFISVDVIEDPAVVQKFLARKKMAGWVGLDTTGKVVVRYGVKEFPTTIIVGKDGRIAMVTYPEALTAADLLAVARGKSMKSEKAMAAVASTITAAPASPAKPLFEISLSKSNVKSRNESGMTGYSTGMEIHGMDADFLLTYTYHLASDRFILTSPLPEGLYDLRAEFAGADDSLTTPMLQTAVASGLHLRVEAKTVTKKAYVLKSTEAKKKLLTPTVSTGGSMWGYQDGTLKLVNQSMDGLRDVLEYALGAPVVNETGIDGTFDAELGFPAKNAEAAKSALLKAMGVDLVQAERPIAMLEVTSLDSATKAAESKPQPSVGK